MNKILILSIVLFGIFACSSDGNDDDPVIPIKVQASFVYTISTVDSHLLFLENTTSGDGFTSSWDYGLGGGNVNDAPGVDTVRYDTAGTYTIKLTVVKDGLTTTATKTIKVDATGICPNGLCSGGGSETLKSAATTFSVGTITRDSYIIAGGKHTETLKADFNNLTSEYQMKMDKMNPSLGKYDFSAGDVIVKFAQENSMNVHGHALIWHSSTPSWVENFAGTNAEFETMVENYITTTLNHFKGKVRSWDVVNEAFEDGTGHPLRNSIFRQKMGDDYIKKCFQFARNADPNVLLFYNDYNIASSSTKRAAIFALVDNLGSLIDGVGAQMHISYNEPSASSIQAVADGTVSRGKKLHFSELDIRANPNNDQTTLTTARADLQAAKFKEVVKIYNSIPLANKFALTTWGVRDNESWLIAFWKHIDWPLMFNEDYSKKPAYNAFLEGLK
ncbi:endo-1,4-beta-xylanase [Mariniflexile sp. AS56]|uniref:endo-1,4-beta-xylanase n=1 Tax=Mariniflexile sp. AS56 TaxID=3063957 RepID=UPI0026E96EA1|nr:endo-1,4-beta-xylanase [Mariniflexile sp. AS56]MDO7173746.1 endo-1,4-beta-xylanase [Mariniflexile sp. AS56]